MNDSSILPKLFFWTCTDEDDDYYYAIDDYMHETIAIPSSASQPIPLNSILKNNNDNNGNKKNHTHQHVTFGRVECKQYFRRRESLEIQSMNYRATIKTCKQEMYEVDQRAKEWIKHIESIFSSPRTIQEM